MKAPARLRGDEFYESAGFGLRTARFTIGRGIASDFIDMLRDHRIGWVNMEGLNEVRARFIGVAEQSRLVRCLHKCRGAVLACNLVRRPVLLVAGNEQYRAAYEIARQHRATALVQAADKARLLGHTDEARSDLIQAFHIDPTNPMVAQHVDEIARDAAPDREPRDRKS